MEQVHRIRGKIRNEREAQAKIASSSTCLAAQCFKYRVAGAKSRDFISESRCTELSIGRALDLRYDDVLSAAVTGTEPRVPDRNSRQEFSDRMKAAPVIGLAIGVSGLATHGGRGSDSGFAPVSSFGPGKRRGVVRTVGKMGKRLDICGKFSDCGLRKTLSTPLAPVV